MAGLWKSPYFAVKKCYFLFYDLKLSLSISNNRQYKWIFDLINFRYRYLFDLRGLREYDSFLTKFDNRTAKMMTGNPTSWTGNSNTGSCDWASVVRGISANSPIKSNNANVDGANHETRICIFLIWKPSAPNHTITHTLFIFVATFLSMILGMLVFRSKSAGRLTRAWSPINY